MHVFLNGRFIAEEDARVSVFDRSFSYGDGIFETVRISSGKPLWLEEHFRRFEESARFFGLPVPTTADGLRGIALELLKRNGLSEAVLRIQLSRGIGERGISISGAKEPTLFVSLHPSRIDRETVPAPWSLVVSPWRTSPGDPILRHKTCSRAFHVIARLDAEQRGANDALILNSRGEVTETTCSNLFWISNDVLCTAPVECGLLPGVTRKLVLQCAARLGIEVRQIAAPVDAVKQADGVFLTVSTRGVVEVRAIDGVPISPSALTGALRSAYLDLQGRDVQNDEYI